MWNVLAQNSSWINLQNKRPLKLFPMKLGSMFKLVKIFGDEREMKKMNGEQKELVFLCVWSAPFGSWCVTFIVIEALPDLIGCLYHYSSYICHVLVSNYDMMLVLSGFFEK